MPGSGASNRSWPPQPADLTLRARAADARTPSSASGCGVGNSAATSASRARRNARQRKPRPRSNFDVSGPIPCPCLLTNHPVNEDDQLGQRRRLPQQPHAERELAPVVLLVGGAGVDLYVRWSNVAADPNVTSGERTYRQGSDRPCAGLRWPRTANPAFGQSLTCRARSMTLILCGGLRESGQSSTSRS